MSTPESKTDALQKRLVSFGSQIFQLTSQLPRTWQPSHVARQVLRSGTAAAANYAEARGAESRADFVHKLRIVLKELNETSVWLRILQRNSLEKTDLIIAIH